MDIIKSPYDVRDYTIKADKEIPIAIAAQQKLQLDFLKYRLISN